MKNFQGMTYRSIENETIFNKIIALIGVIESGTISQNFVS